MEEEGIENALASYGFATCKTVFIRYGPPKVRLLRCTLVCTNDGDYTNIPLGIVRSQHRTTPHNTTQHRTTPHYTVITSRSCRDCSSCHITAKEEETTSGRQHWLHFLQYLEGDDFPLVTLNIRARAHALALATFIFLTYNKELAGTLQRQNCACAHFSFFF